jgi:hypothetical protein
MILFQLFSKVPDAHTLNLLVSFFGLYGINDSSSFSYENLIERGTRQKIIDNLSYLNRFYMPCKARVFLNIETLSLRRCITILNHFLKSHGLSLERIHKRKRKTTYCISS